MSNLLVTGSLGYIAGALIPQLIESDHRVTAIAERSDHWPYGPYDSIVHLGARIDARESHQLPVEYFYDNAAWTVAFASREGPNQAHFIFVSSCVAAYPESSPYAASKAAVEWLLPALAKRDGFTYTILRLFNVGGAHAGHGEQHKPETHIVPRMNEAAILGLPLLLNCAKCDSGPVRDYVHLSDVIAAIQIALDTRPVGTFEVGTGQGSSLKMVLSHAQPGLKVEYAGRREEPQVLVSDPSKWLPGWQPRYGLAEIVRSDMEWRRSQHGQ